MKKWILITLAIIIGAYITYKGYFRIRHMMVLQERNEVFVDKPAPDVTGITSEGEKWSLRSQRGKNVIIVFWASWCPFCTKEIPHILRLAKGLQDDPDTILVSINLDTDPDKARSFIKEKGITYPVLMDEKKLGMKSEISRSFNLNGIPSIWVIDKEGIVKAPYLRQVDKAVEVLNL